jgi:hypothetical protein
VSELGRRQILTHVRPGSCIVEYGSTHPVVLDMLGEVYPPLSRHCGLVLVAFRNKPRWGYPRSGSGAVAAVDWSLSQDRTVHRFASRSKQLTSKVEHLV